MKTDTPCLPNQVTVGDIKNAVIKYIHEEEQKNPFIGLASTSLVAAWALRDAFPCPATQSTVAPAAPKHTYAELQPLLDNRCFRSKTADDSPHHGR